MKLGVQIDTFGFQIYCNHSLTTKPNGHCQTSEFIETVISMSNLLICFNSAANFLLYMLRGKKFRDAFCQTYFGLVCKWCTRPNRNAESPMMSSSAVNNQIIRRPTQVNLNLFKFHQCRERPINILLSRLLGPSQSPGRNKRV